MDRRRVLNSALWASGQQFVLMGANAVVAAILARTVTVAEFGVFSYALALSAIGLAVVSAGLSGLAIKAFVESPRAQAQTLSTLVLIREGFALVAYVILLLVALTTSGSSQAFLATALVLLVLFSRAWDAVEYWYQSRIQSRRSATIRISIVLVLLVVRIIAATFGAGLWFFLASYVVESVAISIALIVRYRRENDSPGFSRPQFAVAAKLLGKSWILLLSGLAAQVNLRADQVIIQGTIGSTAVGIYAAAARLSEIAYFLPTVFMTATFPVLLAVRSEHGATSLEYRSMLQTAYDRAFWGGVAVALMIFALGPTLITTIFGAPYDSAGAILRIHILALPFVFMAAVFSKWILAEDLLMASLVRHAAGAALNVLMNLVLVPSYGIRGSAVATVVSYTTASYLACFIGRSTRSAGLMMTLAIAAPVRYLVRWLQRNTNGETR